MNELTQKLLDMQRQQFAAKLKRRIKSRSTYTESNAVVFQPFFDEAIKSCTDVCIPYEGWLHLQPDVLYRKICDALKWLVEQSPADDDKSKYAVLRSQIVFQRSDKIDEGVWIRFNPDRRFTTKRGLKGGSLAAVERVHEAAANTAWKEDLFAWMETSAEENPKFIRENLMLTRDDITMIENIAQQQLWEYKVNTNRILIIR